MCEVLSLIMCSHGTRREWKMPGSLADIAGTTDHTRKLVYHASTEPTRDRILYTKHAVDFKG